MSMPFVARMIHVRNVAWGRDPTGEYWVQWNEDGTPHARTFRTAHSAENFARWLDTTGAQPTRDDIRAIEKSMHELEEEVFELDEERRAELAALGVPMVRTPRQARRIERLMARLERPVRVRGHGRRIRRT